MAIEHTTHARALLGRHGEELAAAHLTQRGFDILARNERTRCGEIDLIAFDGSTLVFAEVKTRRVSAAAARLPAELGWPSARQRRRLRGLALAWLSDRRRRRPLAREIRFDLLRVLVGPDGALAALEHLEGAC